jgi:hypothetical protein
VTWKAGAYPVARERPLTAPLSAVPKYGRLDGPLTDTTLADTDATVFTFSGRPDKIILTARSFPALVTLTDRLNRETSTLMVPVNGVVSVELARERIVARNAIAGSNAVLGVVGMWGEAGEPSSQREQV